MGVLQNITGALDGHLNTLTGKPDIAWPNSDYKPAEGVLFLSVAHLPASNENITLNYTEEHLGIYQVLVVGAAGQYKSETEAMADNIVDHFLSNRELTYNGLTVKILTAQFNAGLSEGAWYQIPVSIDYRAYVQR